MNNVEKIIDRLDKDFEKFDGHKALFWSGRISNIISIIENCSIFEFSKNFEILKYCKRRYDEEIIKK